MHRLWRKRGRRIRPNDKDLVFRTVFFLLFAVFAVTFVLLNIRTDWRSPSVALPAVQRGHGCKSVYRDGVAAVPPVSGQAE